MEFYYKNKDADRGNWWMIIMAVSTILMAMALSGYIFRWHSIFKPGFPGSPCEETDQCLDGLTCKDKECGCG